MSSEILTNEEMSALLPETSKGENSQGERRRRIVPYNFRRPDRLSKEQVRSLYLLHDTFAHALSSSLPLFLRLASEVNLISVEQQSYSEYLKAISDPTVIFSLMMSPLQGSVVVEVSPEVAFPLIDRMLGGKGAALSETRAATELELKVIEGFISPLAVALREAWKPIIELDLQVLGRETRPQLVQAVSPNEVVLTLSFHLKIADSTGTMTLCLPIVMLESVIDKFNQSSYSQKRLSPPKQIGALIETLSTTRFSVSAELLKTRAATEDLMDLAVGDVLRTSHRTDQPILLNVGGIPKFTGNLAASDSRMVLKINSHTTKNKKLFESKNENSKAD